MLDRQLEVSKVISVPSYLRFVINESGAVILDIPNNGVNTLNPIGAYIWERLQRGMLPDAIVAELVRDTGMGADVVMQDLNDFIDQLESKQLIEIC